MLGYPDDEIGQLTYEQITPARWHAHEARVLAEADGVLVFEPEEPATFVPLLPRGRLHLPCGYQKWMKLCGLSTVPQRPPLRISKWRCGPVLVPVFPLLATVAPLDTCPWCSTKWLRCA